MSVSSADTKATATFSDYVRIARFDHITKHVFIIPGIVLAVLLRGVQVESLTANMLLGFIAATAVMAANYVINEWLDREFDAHHPEKSARAAVQKQLMPAFVYLEYAALLAIGIGVAALVNNTFAVIAIAFALSGMIYNIEPIRSKDKAFVDVLSESINNPLRLLFGWTMVDPGTVPPGSLLLAFWFGGAFLMNSKRLAEYRDIFASDGPAILAKYRKSFAYYTEVSLSVANLVYALLCAFFIAIFLIKYRIEYIILFPCIVALFAEYYSLALTPNSVARKPEVLFKAKTLIGISGVTFAVFLFASFVDLPVLLHFTDQFFIPLGTGAAG